MPSLRSATTTASVRSGRISATMTKAPASPSACAQAAPMPCPPPVITATRSSSLSLFRYKAHLGVSLLAASSLRNPPFIKPMKPCLVRRQKHCLAMPKIDFAISTRGHLAHTLDIHVQEGVGAQMLSYTDRSFPLALGFR